MGNVINSFFNGFAEVIGRLLSSPLDFVQGKSCSSVCGVTWDFICYVENFCVANLMKMAMVSALIYIGFLFLYILYKLGIYNYIVHGLCKMVWACMSCWFSLWKSYCFCLCNNLLTPRTRRHSHHKRHDHRIDLDTNNENENYYSDVSRSKDITRRPISKRVARDYKRVQLKKSLKPRSHRVHVEFGSYSGERKLSKNKHKDHVGPIHDRIKVSHSSKFVRKGRKVKRPKGYVHRNR